MHLLPLSRLFHLQLRVHAHLVQDIVDKGRLAACLVQKHSQEFKRHHLSVFWGDGGVSFFSRSPSNDDVSLSLSLSPPIRRHTRDSTECTRARERIRKPRKSHVPPEMQVVDVGGRQCRKEHGIVSPISPPLAVLLIDHVDHVDVVDGVDAATTTTAHHSRVSRVLCLCFRACIFQ